MQEPSGCSAPCSRDSTGSPVLGRDQRPQQWHRSASAPWLNRWPQPCRAHRCRNQESKPAGAIQSSPASITWLTASSSPAVTFLGAREETLSLKIVWSRKEDSVQGGQPLPSPTAPTRSTRPRCTQKAPDAIAPKTKPDLSAPKYDEPDAMLPSPPCLAAFYPLPLPFMLMTTASPAVPRSPRSPQTLPASPEGCVWEPCTPASRLAPFPPLHPAAPPAGLLPRAARRGERQGAPDGWAATVSTASIAQTRRTTS